MSSAVRNPGSLPGARLFINVAPIPADASGNAEATIFVEPSQTIVGSANEPDNSGLARVTWNTLIGGSAAGTVILRDLGKTVVQRNKFGSVIRAWRKVQLVNPADPFVTNSTATLPFCTGYIRLGSFEGGSLPTAAGQNNKNAAIWARTG